MESPMVQIEREFRQRARVIREQMQNIQNSFVTIGFQLHWIREHNMFRVMNYKSIYEYAEKECGIGRSSCGNLISIIENFAERDENGRVVESISECYRNYSSSQLVAMVGMPDSMKQQVTPDMSVRSINRMRRGIPDKQAEEAAAGAETRAEAEAQAGEEAALRAVPQTAGQGPEAQAAPAEEAEVPVAVKPEAADPAREDVREPEGVKPAAGKGGAKGTGKTPETAAEPPRAAEGSPAIKADAGKPGDSAPAAGKTPQETGGTQVPAETGQGKDTRTEKGPGTDGTLFTFDSYSTYREAQGKIGEMMEAVFSRGSAVTVKIVCVQG